MINDFPYLMELVKTFQPYLISNMENYYYVDQNDKHWIIVFNNFNSSSTRNCNFKFGEQEYEIKKFSIDLTIAQQVFLQQLLIL